MTLHTSILTLLSLAAAALQIGCGDNGSPSYRSNIKPILDTHCVSCHVPGGAGHEKSGLRLDSYDAMMKGSRVGPVVRPGSSVAALCIG